MILSSLTLAFPTIDPIITQIGPLAIRWYGVAYVVGILLGWKWMRYLSQHPPFKGLLTQEQIDQFLTFAILSIVIGGRFGYVLFYSPELIWNEPLRIVQTWTGGMSFHGGFLGMIVASWWFTKKHTLSFLRFTDILVCVAPIGLFFGRIANFINAELFGRTTDVPWGMVFPDAGPLPRHPSQLYEAFLEGIVLFVLCNLLIRNVIFKKAPGKISGVFLLAYGICRTLVECVREPDGHLGYFLEILTWGQILTIPMIMGGLFLLFRKP